MWMQTFTGKKIDFKNIKPDDICIEDIAHSLSQIARFGGHAKKRYSVAEHCILGARIAEPEHKFSFLMHDAAEAYIGDIVKPWKEVLAENGKLIETENNLNDLIQKKFKLKFKADSPEMKKLDSHMIIYEAPQVFNSVIDHLHLEFKGQRSLKPPFMEFMSEEEAEQEFLKMFYKLAYDESAKIIKEVSEKREPVLTHEDKIDRWVLATEYETGMPTHMWAVGKVKKKGDRIEIINPRDFWGSGPEISCFKRVEVITKEMAEFLMGDQKTKETAGLSLWYWKEKAERLLRNRKE